MGGRLVNGLGQRWRHLLGVGLLAAALAGCGQVSTTPLPELTPVSRPLLTPAEQKKAMAEIEAERVKASTEAIRTIEQRR